MLSQYQQKRDNLLKLYEKLEEMVGLLPIEGYSKEDKVISVDDIREKREQLKDEHFFVSVTGQIKAGKSTLINALVFGDEILPADDVPHTAKITLLKYAEEPRIEVIFYSKDEWDELSNSEYFHEYIKDELENSIKSGIHKVEVIKREPMLKRDTIDQLAQYVARAGKYTPYVNTVTLYYPSEILKEITIVDTPGTNDPNKVRDRVAKEWISKTNANIYIIYAGQAFSQADMEFMKKYLLSVPKEQKITVINKIDTVASLSSVKSWVDTLSRDEDLKNREILDRDSKVIYACGLAALIDKMEKSEIELSDDLDFHADRLDKEGYLDPAKYNISELEKAIESKLIHNKGDNIISSHQQFIASLFKKKLSIKKSKLAIHMSNLEDLGSSREELDDKLATIRKMIDSLNTMMDDVDKKLKGNIEDATEVLRSEIKDKKIKMAKKVESEIEALDTIKKIENSIGWIVKKEMDIFFQDISKILKSSKEEVITIVRKEISEVENRLRDMDRDNVVEMGSVENMIYMSVVELEDEAEQIMANYLEDNKISNLMEDYKHLFWFNETSAAKPKMKEYLRDMMRKIERGINIMFSDRITTIVKGTIIGKAEHNIRKILNDKEENVKRIANSLDQKQTLISEESQMIDNLKNEIKKIEKLRTELDG